MKRVEHEDKILRCVKVEACRKPEEIEIENSLEAILDIIDGFMEIVRPFHEDEHPALKDAVIICNDEGKIDGLFPNRALFANGEAYDFIAGTFLVVGEAESPDGGVFVSLTDEEAEAAKSFFKHPHLILGNGVQILELVDDEEE